MNFTSIFPLISAILVFLLGVIVLKYGSRKKINFIFTLFSLTMAIWMFGTFMMFINKNNVDAVIFWDKFVYIGVVFLPAIMYHFGLALTEDKIVKGKVLLFLGYILSFIFLGLLFTNLFISGVFVYEWGAHTKAQLFHHIFLIYFIFYVSLWFVVVSKYYRLNITSIERERIKYCFLAFFILAIFGSLGYLPAYGISIYPFAYFSGVIFTLILAYAIVAHRLLDIRLVMRRYSVYLTSLITILIPAIAIKYVFSLYFLEIYILADVIILVLGILIFSPIKNYYYRVANKYFFSSLYDSRQVIADISDKLRSTLDINKIYSFIYNSLNSAFYFKAFSILTYNDKSKNYFFRYNKGFNLGRRKKLLFDKELYEYFARKNDPIIMEEIKKTQYEKYKKIINLFSGINIEILTPLNVKEKNIGIIALGAKESGDMYNNEDLQVLEVIGAQTAIAIENALLYNETLNFSIKLEKEVKAATKELREANEKLKQLDKAKSEFISIASHQLRTPLTVIKGYISMMLEGSFGELAHAERDPLEKVYESGERLIQLVENLLNISRIESGRLQFIYEIMNLEDIVDSVVDELNTNIKKKKLHLDYIKPKKAFPKVKIDEEKIRQVIMNLIDNAIKYTKKGSITVNLSKVKEGIQFCVSDSGIGVQKEDMPNLFKKFSRGKGISMVHTEGTGLGLYVAKQMIEAHNGKIWVESEGVGKGSKFYFILPVNN